MLKVRGALTTLGRHPEPEPDTSGFIDEAFDRRVRGYQRDRGLKVDGWLRPGGETERLLGFDVGLLDEPDMALPIGIGAPPKAVAGTAAPSPALREARGFFGRVGSLFGALGFDQAKRHLDRYRSATGEPLELSRETVERFPMLERAEEVNRQRFETKTFLGQSGNDVVNALLRGLADGGEARFNDGWQRAYGLSGGSVSDRARSAVEFAKDPQAYAALGQTGVSSLGDFVARRKGGRISIDGMIDHELNSERWERRRPPAEREDRSDFLFGQPGGIHAHTLEAMGEAKPFPMRYVRQQRVNAEVRLAPGGRFTLDRATWSPVEQ